MMGHVIYPEVWSDLPASLEPEAYELLRDRGFDGVAVTDALGMGAVHARFGFDVAPAMALTAGADAVLVNQGDQVRGAARRHRRPRSPRARLTEERLNDAVTRLLGPPWSTRRGHRLRRVTHPLRRAGPARGLIPASGSPTSSTPSVTSRRGGSASSRSGHRGGRSSASASRPRATTSSRSARASGPRSDRSSDTRAIPPLTPTASAHARTCSASSSVCSVRSIRQSGSLSQRRRCRNERLRVLRQALTVAGSPPSWPGGSVLVRARVPPRAPRRRRCACRRRGPRSAPSGAPHPSRKAVVASPAADRLEAGPHPLGRRPARVGVGTRQTTARR